MLVPVVRTLLSVLLCAMQLADEPQHSDAVMAIDEVSRLSRDQASASPKINVEGTVTYVNQVWDTMFVQDETGGLYVYSSKLPEVAVGEVVRVSGMPLVGERGIYLELNGCERIGVGEVPDPISVNSQSFHQIRSDSHLVELIGIVRRVTSADDHFFVVLAHGTKRVTVHLPHSTGLEIDAPDFIGRQVHVKGVWSVKRTEVGYDFELFVAADGLVEISAPPAVAKRSIDELHWIDSRTNTSDLVKVRANVSCVSGDRVFIFDDTAPAMVIVTDGISTDVKPGAVVDVVGFVQWDCGAPCVEDASIDVAGQQAAPTPVEIPAIEVAKRIGELVRFEGVVIEIISNKAGQNLWLRAGESRFATQAIRNDSSDDFHVGDRVLVEGVVWARSSNTPAEFDLHLNSSPIVTSSVSSPNSVWWQVTVVGLILAVFAAFIWDRRRQARDRSMQQHIAGRLDELSHVARINTLGDMVAALSHELNQPLASIANYAAAAAAQLGKGSVTVDGNVVKCLSGIEDQANRAGGVIRRLKNLVNRKAPEKSWVNLNEVILETVDLFKTGHVCSSSLIRLELQPQLPKTHLDVLQTQQVVLNLLSNARDATMGLQDLAEIAISTKCDDGDHVQVAVEDNGCGIAGEVLEAMFEPYYTTKERSTGLGLAISRAIVEAHGGTMTAQPRATRGCQIRIVLPSQGSETECRT